MDPDVTLALGLSALAESKASYPADWGSGYPEWYRADAREFAKNLFDWICKNGYYPKDRDGCNKLLSELGFDLKSLPVLRHCRECRTVEGQHHKMDCATGRGYGVWRNDPWH